MQGNPYLQKRHARKPLSMQRKWRNTLILTDKAPKHLIRDYRSTRSTATSLSLIIGMTHALHHSLIKKHSLTSHITSIDQIQHSPSLIFFLADKDRQIAWHQLIKKHSLRKMIPEAHLAQPLPLIPTPRNRSAKWLTSITCDSLIYLWPIHDPYDQFMTLMTPYDYTWLIMPLSLDVTH